MTGTPSDDVRLAILETKLGALQDQFDETRTGDARDHIRSAVTIAQTVERPGRVNMLLEKIVGVRLTNELWAGEPCETVAPFAQVLEEMLIEMPMPPNIDPVRDLTQVHLGNFNRRCPS
ncbi:MAG: hypothetical protein AAF340_17560 [Pseudomonadota bacterium]